MTKYEKLLRDTNNTCILWKHSRGIAPDSAADIMDEAMLPWLMDLTKTLEIWINKDFEMTDGELILARANLGAIVESWLRLFLSIYVEDYKANPYTNNKGNRVKLDQLRFVDLQEYVCDTVWEGNKPDIERWMNNVRDKRNAIHAFKKKDLGTVTDFFDDLEKFYEFVDLILNHLPPIEDYVDTYPKGYIPVTIWD